MPDQNVTVCYTQKLLRIGELAQKTRTGKATIEHYLKLGILSPERVEPQGYRLFGDESVARIHLLKKARLAGFGLPEVRAMFDAIPLKEIDDILTSKPPLECREELRAKGVEITKGVS